MNSGPDEPGDDERDTDDSGDASPLRTKGEAAPPWGGWTAPPSEEQYTAMWRAYRDGTRSKKALRTSLGLSKRLVYTAVERGWPEQDWPSLRSRLALSDRQMAKARAAELERTDRALAIASGKTAAEAWREFAPKAMTLTLEGLETLGILGRKIRSAAEAATFTRYRRVRKLIPAQMGMDGVMTEPRTLTVDELYVDASAVAKAMALFTSGGRDLSTAMAFLVGGGRSEGDEAPELTPEQIDQIAQGEMPIGLTMEQVARAVLAGKVAGEKEGA